MNADLLQGFYLRNLLVEPLTGKVTGPSGNAHLGSRATEVLLQLAASPGEVVARKYLLEKVWGEGKGNHDDLEHAVAEIQKALDDDGDVPVFIQGLPDRGYRLIVTPELVGEATSSIVIGAEDGARVGDIGFLENLKRRGVIETGIAYLVVGWLIIQVVDSVFDQLHLPAWAGTFVTVLVIAGFPIAIALSWFLEFRGGDAVFDNVSAVEARRRRFSRTYLSVIGALAVAAVLVFAYDRYVGLPEGEDADVVANAAAVFEPPPVTRNSIAVLPFMNIDGSNDTQIFANGLVDDVITRLSRVPGLLVSSRGDSFTLPANSRSKDVRSRLRVAQYLEGSVQLAGDKIRVIVQLIDSESGFHIFSRSFDHELADFFQIRDAITNLTVANVRAALPETAREIPDFATADPSLDAYVLYRRGIEETGKPRTTETVQAALQWFDSALGVDPDYAAAHAGKCRILVGNYHLTNDPKSITDAETSCARALNLNPNLDIVHTALGDLYRHTGKYADAEIAYRAALRIHPKSVEAMTGLAKTYGRQQRNDESKRLLEKSIGMQPGNWSPYNDLGFLLYQQGQYAEAAEQYATVLALDNTNLRGYQNLAAAQMMAGDFAAAAPTYQRAIEIEPQASTFSNLAMMHYYLGRTSEAVAAIERSIALAPNDHLAWSNLGDILWADGQRQEATEAFSKALDLANVALGVNPNDVSVMMDVSWIHAMLDEHGVAISKIDEVAKLLPDDPFAFYIKGLILERAGKPGAAIEALSSAVQKGYPLNLLSADPHLVSLRDDPRFVAIIDRPEGRKK